MKKIALFVCGLGLSVLSVCAQKTEVKRYVTTQQSFSETQARMVDVTARSYVMPLVAEVEVVSDVMKVINLKYTRTEVEVGMDANSENLRSRVLYDATNKEIVDAEGNKVLGWNCDLIVAATFKIQLSKDQKWYEVEMKGFPANFKKNSWRSVKDTDYEWIRLDKLYGGDERMGQAISNVKK